MPYLAQTMHQPDSHASIIEHDGLTNDEIWLGGPCPSSQKGGKPGEKSRMIDVEEVKPSTKPPRRQLPRISIGTIDTKMEQVREATSQ
ncbi:uncharacterized protein BBA_04867 [Beauveria bassiana ARSEF 2860]|uniref:Uncharacterized protein n=1 Tax=Beauveria bassiana (strain ARSEF 2860) TaxID=655819 RepID=J4KNV7_BEAB2|nr:uncharacterized protein BBA_04867 [Beauveria bassiana ARSEF 2860]EJP66374.1 hypothetical protein BBA_04867 [Beauveria bassiana ARSEF 2860]